MILYLHGFRSSPASFKSTLLARTLAERGLSDRWHCPALPPGPQAAATLALDQARQLQQTAVAHGDTRPEALTLIGSSLGGYYATWIAEQLGCQAVLLNPAVHPDRDLARYLAQQDGPLRNYHTGEPLDFHAGHLAELAALRVAKPTRLSRYLLLAATGDEVLDWREMRDYYAGCQQIIIPGSDHGLSDFESWLPAVLAFAGLDGG